MIVSVGQRRRVVRREERRSREGVRVYGEGERECMEVSVGECRRVVRRVERR